ncbi:MAG TPA: tRNA pseudouridine(55) synthase TruB [bacterium]|nr:tRNA pseudouridine(55) synthase TruB [bacterium]
MLRNMNGFLIINKPKGKSSFWAVERIRRISKQKKVGHAGTLDPLASGVLVLCLGEATKLSNYAMDENKVYKVTGRLGMRTTTLDAEGEIIQNLEVSAIDVNKEKLVLALEGFKGWIEQMPPMHSAIKKDGAPLYRLARRGISIEREKRRVFISEISLLDFNFPFYTLKVSCSKGTYIRTLIDDIGLNLGVGSYVTDLERLRSGAFDIKDAIDLKDNTTVEELENNIIDMEKLVSSIMPIIDVPYELAKKVSDGYSLADLGCELFFQHKDFAVMSILDDKRTLVAVVENGAVRVFNHRRWSNNVQ